MEDCIVEIANIIGGSMHSVPTVNSWLSGSASTVNIETGVTEELANEVKRSLKHAVKTNFEEVQAHMNFFSKSF